MVVFIAISIMAHLLSLLAILVLYKKRSVERLNIPTLQEDVQTIHESLESFIDELEKENEMLYEKLVEYVQNKEADQYDQMKKVEKNLSSILNRLDVLEQQEQERNDQYSQTDEPSQTLHAGVTNNESVRKVEESGQERQKWDDENMKQKLPMPNRHQKVIHYYQEGLDIEEIAQTLQIGKGEVRLVVNMFQRSMVQQLNSPSKP